MKLSNASSRKTSAVLVFLTSLLLSTALITSCATSPTGRSQLMLVSPEKAIKESEKAYIATVKDLESKQQLVTDASRVKRIRDITGRLVSVAARQYPNSADWKWSVAIINDPKTLNAWCMAGGRMAIYTGIIDQLSLNDDEIAQIMGHELAHALANHTAERMSRAMMTSVTLKAASLITGEQSMALTGAAAAAKFALTLPNSRAGESEADRIGIELAARAGYRPEAAVSLWEKMKKAGGSGGPEFMSTHPSPSSRAKTLSKLGADMMKLNPGLKRSPVSAITVVTSSQHTGS